MAGRVTGSGTSMAGSLKILMLIAAAGLAPFGPALFGGGACAAEAEAWNFQCMEDEEEESYESHPA